MTQYKILLSNLGYLRDVDGTAASHLAKSWRHVYCPLSVQYRSLAALRTIISEHNPDLICLLEIDTGSLTSGGLNQFALLSHDYPCHDVASKYDANSYLQRWSVTKGKSSAFLAKACHAFERIYFTSGTKRLVYRVEVSDSLAVFFTHLSLKEAVRRQQLRELKVLIEREARDVVVLGDFNILAGLGELDELTDGGRIRLMNDPTASTFQLFKKRYLLDVCLMSQNIGKNARVSVIPQSFSDHDAILAVVEAD